MSNRKQRLELTWIGKSERSRLEPRILLEDEDKSHHAKVRSTDQDIFDNILIHGDNLLALKALEQDYTGRVKCIYIDPPFNTQQAFSNYDDGLEHSVWLNMMRERVEMLHKLLAKDGSCFIHIDDNELAYLIALTDEIFGRRNRISVITFKQSAASGPKSINPGVVSTSNFILYYVKDREVWEPNRVYVPIARDARYNNFIENYEDGHLNWRITTLRQAFADHHEIAVGDIEKNFGSKTEERFTKFVLENSNKVVQPALVRPEDINAEARKALFESEKNAGVVTKSESEERYFRNGKQLLFYASKVRTVDGEICTAGLLTTIWDDLFSNNLHKEGGVSFPGGKKPEALIKRLLEIATRPGDLVLDSFGGSGSTAAAAHKMHRRWITVELGDQANTHIVPRLKTVIDGKDDSGITNAVSWKGGGGFRYYRLAPSLLEKDRWDNWIIAKDYDSAKVAQAICKLMGFVYQPDETYYWMQGRSSETDFIYVTTQSLTRDQLAAISSEVGEDRTLLVCCKAFRANPDAFSNLTIKKIPQAVLRKCEWGKDDYSLNVVGLPEAALPEPDDPGDPEPPSKAGRKRSNGKATSQNDLFNQGGGK